MYDPTFHPRTLKAELTAADLRRDPHFTNERVREALIERAGKRAVEGYNSLELTTTKINGSQVYKLAKFEDELVLRKVARNVSRVTSVRQSNRNNIISCLKSLLREGLPFRVYKIDIKIFYDSINHKLFLEPITSDSAFPPSTTRLLCTFFEETSSRYIAGLPRGLAISSVLSEYIMRDFDRRMAKHGSVFFYSRFVDDMIFVTRGDESPKSFFIEVEKTLPEGLTRNISKTKCWPFGTHQKAHKAEHVEDYFDFLGYRLYVGKCHSIKNAPHSRMVKVDIADKKVKRIKTRICIAFLQYIRDRNIDDLVSRVRMLCGNFVIYDSKKGRFTHAGIYQSYKMIDVEDSSALQELDKFYRKMLLSNRGKICGILSKVLPNCDRKKLLKYSFQRGYINRVFFNHNPDKIENLRRCWINA